MKSLANVFCFVVGALFIFSGFVKAIDPEGFAYKLTEYFLLEEFRFFGTEFFTSTALLQSILICAFEILLGFALLLRHNIKTYAWHILLMIIFFTFLTGYSWGFEVVKECGCFGNAIPLTAGQSFIKDLILLVLVVIIFIERKNITQIAGRFKQGLIFTFLGGFLSIGISVWGLNHLPMIDFRAYQEGAHILEKINDGEPAQIEYWYIFEKDGQQQETQNYAELSAKGWTFVEPKIVTLKEEVKPSIEDFVLTNEEGDLTTDILNHDVYYFFMITKHIEKVKPEVLTSIEALHQDSGLEMIGLTASGDEELAKAVETAALSFDFYNCDEKALATFVRANPGIVLMKGDLIIKKWHHKDLPSVEAIKALTK